MTQHSFYAPTSASATDLDAIAICHRIAGYDFPWDLNRALELAVLRTICVPRISALLHHTGEFIHRPQKRYDDTGLILGNVMKWGYDSPQGKAAIAQMNRIHQRYAIRNEDFLYVLSTTIYEPVRWNERYGRRPFTRIEREAMFEFWCEVGRRMGITDIPATYAAFEQFNRAYEARHFCYSPDNQAIGDAVVALMQSWMPAIAAPLVPLAVKALVDEPMRRALGWSSPPASVSRAIARGLRWSRRRFHRKQAATPQFAIDVPTRTYPNGYHLEQLGPTADVLPSTRSRCPFLRMQAWLKLDAQ